MPSIRATRDDVTDRFPMLGFTINTGGDPYFEVVLTTDPSLPRERRTPENFFSTRGVGPLRADRGEAVYLVPPNILRRFAGQQRLWFGLATFRDASRSQADLVRIPTSTSPYVSLRAFGGRSSRRIHITPVSRPRNGGARYQEKAPEDLVWAGDDARPGSESIALNPATTAPKQVAPQPPEAGGNGHDPGDATATPPSASTPPQSARASLAYDDGFGELPPVAPLSPRRSRPLTDSLNEAAQHAKDQGANPDEVDEFLSRLRAPAAAQGFAGQRRPPARPFDGRTEIRLPGGTQIEGWRAELLIVALETVLAPFGAGFAIPALRLAATEAGVSIGLGPTVSGGLLSGGSLGVGIVFAPHNVVGFYGATELSAGLLAGISATLQVTVVRGGLESFNGSGYAVGLSGGEEIVAGAAVILDADSRFQGVSAQVGVGIGLSPVEIYTSAQRGYSTAHSLGVRRTRPFDNDGIIAFRDRLSGEGLTDEQVDQFLAEFGGAGATTQEFRARGRLGASPFDERIQIHLPGATTISGWRARALLVALEAVATGAASAIPGLGVLAPAVGSLIASLPAICDRLNVTIGIGPNVAAFPVAGGSIGAGIVFAPGGVIGLYGSGEVGMGVILGISAVAQVTIVGGGIANFAGDSAAIVVGGGEGIVGGVAVLLAPDQTFQGVSFQLGVGAGISPIDVYMSMQHTWTTTQGLGLARSGAARALEDDGRVPIRLPRARRLSTTERLALQTALGLAGPLGVLVNTAMAATDAGQVTIGIGPAVEAGLLAGGGLSVGLIFAPGGVIGVYGSVEAAAGVLGSISATAQITIIRGGIEEFGEAGYAIGISGGEELYGGAAALFTETGVFHGVSFRLGIGGGVIPIDIFVAAERRFASPPPSPAPATPATPSALTITSRRDRISPSPRSRPASAQPSRPVGRPLTEIGPAGDPAEEEGYEEESAVVSAAQTATECTDDHCPVAPAATAGTVHFSLAEFQCRDGTPVPERFRGNAQQVMENLEIFRSEIGDKPITLVSGYRTCAYNSTLEGAASRSRHLCSQAADIRVTDLTPLQVRDIIERLIGEGRMHQGGLGLYDTFVHYDVRGTRARWDRRRRTASSGAARSFRDPGDIVPDYSQAASTAQAIGLFFEWLRQELKFRIGVPSTDFFPHSAICKLRLLDANGDLIGEGSGFYIGNHRLLTAGHCLVNDDGSRVQAVEVIPGMHGNSQPFGGATVALSALKPHPRYNPSAYDPSFDLGVITAAPDAPHGEFFEMEELRMSPNTGIITCGYAAVGVDPRVQHMDVDTIRELHNGTFTYAAQVRQGSSGGPVFYALDSSHIRVVGLNVTTYDAQQNRGLRLTDELIAWINSQ
jgi:V8-like Glu-specific endopeptidase